MSIFLLSAGLITFFLYIHKLLDIRQKFTPESILDFEKRRPTNDNYSFKTKKNRKNLRVAIAPVISPEKSLLLYQKLIAYLGEKLDYQTAFIQRQSYSEINSLVRLKRCDLAFVCTYAYILGKREFNMKLLAIPQIKGKTTYRSFIITLAKSKIASLLNLRNKRFASADEMSTSGWLFPMTEIKKLNKDAEHFFSQHLITGSHDRSIYAVLSEIVDGAAVDSLVFQRMAFNNASILQKIKILQISQTFGMPPLVTSATINPQLQKKLQHILFTMHNDQNGKKILDSLHIDKFIAASDKQYDSVRRMLKFWKANP